MVGAQVTYSCDTDLVLVGETVATCSLPSLQWAPSSDDIMCVQPSLGKSYIIVYYPCMTVFIMRVYIIIFSVFSSTTMISPTLSFNPSSTDSSITDSTSYSPSTNSFLLYYNDSCLCV